MKKLFLLATVLMFQAACSSDNATQTILPVDQPVDVQAASASSHSPMFLDKLKMGKNYKVLASMKAHAVNSICGPDDKQEINSYDGSLGQTVDFVKSKQSAVAAMESKGVDNSSKFCTGTMISEDLFLTASHCVESGTPTSNFLSFNFEKAKGSQKLLQQEHFKVLEVVEEGDSSKTDYAILRIDGKPGAKFGYTPVDVNPVEDDELLTIIQHPSGLPKQVEVGHKGKTNSGVYMGYGDIDTEPGSSGSGVINSKGSVIGVHTNGGCGPSSGENKAVKMTEIVKVSKTIQTLIKNPAIKKAK